MRFELFVAARYLRAKRRQAVIGVITVISVIGVAAGVSSLVIALAINNGFRQDLQERLLGSTSHVNLMRIENDGIKDWRALLTRLEKTPHVLAASPAIYEQVLISRGARAKGAVLKGIVPERERAVSQLLSYVSKGSAQPLAEAEQRHEAGKAQPPDQGAGNSAAPVTTGPAESPSSLAGVRRRVEALPPIILGKDMADELGADVNSVVLVTSPQGELTPFGIVPKYVRFKVVGIFRSGFYDYDSAWALTDLADSQRLFGLGDLVSVLEFKLDDIYKAGRRR